MQSGSAAGTHDRVHIWIDADACPRDVKEVVFRASARLGLHVTLVANKALFAPPAFARVKALQVSFHADHGRLSCAAALREMPSKRIMKTFRLQLDIQDDASFTSEASRVSAGVVDARFAALR